jgi:hypothetical protein
MYALRISEAIGTTIECMAVIFMRRDSNIVLCFFRLSAASSPS